MEELNQNLFLKEILLKHIKCFKGEYKFTFTDKNIKPAQWTVFLGNNNTGKTTLLRAIAEMQATPVDLNRITKGSFLVTDLVPQASSWHTNSPSRSIRLKVIGSKIQVQVFECAKLNIDLPLNKQFFLPLEPDNWGMWIDETGRQSLTVDRENIFKEFIIYGYGALRRRSKGFTTDNLQDETTASLFSENVTLENIEEWLLKLYIAHSNTEGELKERAAKRISQIESLISSGIFPDVKGIKVKTDDNLNSYIEFLTDSGESNLDSFGYGYQSTLTWVIDYIKKLFDRYPNLDNPLHGPAIVLIDEIDLHLHPEWQRKIIKYLSDLFPNTQFIVTAHSPLIVQSAENVNLVMLEKDEATGSINVRQQFGSFQGWTVEEILRELMDLGEKTRSDRYLELMREFEDSLLEENYVGAKTAYEELDKILSPSSHQRKVLQIQMSSLIPA